ncbi:DUF262 domain-containing protein [Bacteroides sp. 51]|uniref:DUF262 domain-containing protein n=1 Tax=Bacteroides sp. 51 TaxID=2302938 RepID=UPI001EF1CC75|nr:DUF262 domain-containing protein [Bacteroides sp. 51]
MKNILVPKLNEIFQKRKYNFEINHRHNNRFIQLNTILNNDSDVHYEYYQGFVELHLEGKYSSYDYNDVWRTLVDESRKHNNLSWHRWSERNQGRCRYAKHVESPEDIIEGFEYLSNIFDPILKDIDDNTNEDRGNVTETLPLADLMKVNELTTSIVQIKNLPFNNFVIPEYQRPYKWTVKNVNQLINDLLAFRKNKEYRLGTLVLNDNNIVDGQQRIVTLSLILHVLFSKQDISQKSPYQEVQDKVNTFWKRTKFKNEHSIAHVRENLTAIKERIEDLDSKFLDFLLQNCQFVMVQLPKVSEAFQFFDSQNARGKDLEPHDLLKAFHLREINTFSENDSSNITYWQGQNSNHLVNLFLTLYRIKKWSKNNSGREFTKSDIDVFKGISLGDKRYPFYMQQLICHYFSHRYSNDITRNIDGSNMEFPFQLDQTCINGSRFFDMIRHYNKLYNHVTNCEHYKVYDSESNSASAYKIIDKLNKYPNRNRKGDMYVRQLFNSLLMYYIDRYGYEEINKITRKIFKYVYALRLAHFSIQLSTIDNKATMGRMFKAIRDSQSPYDIINLSIQFLPKEQNARNADNIIQELYY